MLNKVWTGNVVCNTETFTLSEDKYSTNSNYTTVFSYSFQGTGALAINASSYMRSNSNEHSGYEWARILVDGVVVSEKTGYSTVAGNHVVNMTLTTGGTHTVVFQCKWYPATWTSSGGWRQWGTVSFTHTLYPNNKNYGKPTKVDQIGTISWITIFGMINGNFFKNDAFDQYLTISGTTQSATTGSITPGNFVWYLQIWSYKIPYYT